MMTSTIAISTKVKPVSVDFFAVEGGFTHRHLLMERLEVLAQQVLIHPGFHVGRTFGAASVASFGCALLLRADLSARRFIIVHLPVDSACDFFQAGSRKAYDRAGEAQPSRIGGSA